MTIDTRSRLIETTRKLLLSSKNPEKITARQISSNANVNLAMINYCFDSKDELLKIVIDNIINWEFKQYEIELEKSDEKPKEKVKKLLYYMSKVTIKYEKITKLSIPYILLDASIEIPFGIFPYIKEHFDKKRDEKFCRIISYEIIAFLQVIFYRIEDFHNYSGVDIYNDFELKEFISNQIDIFLGVDNEK